MPPKKGNQPNKKTVEKQKEKIIEDKTFGLKNKKGAKQQKFIKMVTHQVKNQGVSMSKIESEKREKQKKKTDLDDLNALFKPVVNMPKISKGPITYQCYSEANALFFLDVDPKSVLCPFFKQGACNKGDKCKFSHDLSIDGKAEKRSIYVDRRDMQSTLFIYALLLHALFDDTIDNWDEETLKEVLKKKHGEADKNKSATTIICKFFLQALEESKYGWFWECPNGDKCIYRSHAVPPGFVLKKDRIKPAENKEEISLEDLIERERAALGDNLTKVTLETFLKWKERKRKELLKRRAEEEKRKRNEYKSGKDTGLSGRELFTYNPDLMRQDDEEADEMEYVINKENEEEDVKAVDVSEEMFLKGIGMVGDIDEELFNPDDMPDEDVDGNGSLLETGASAQLPSDCDKRLSNDIEKLNMSN
ncbi:zf-CCCH domain containing protein [Trichuris trichiura]|uniref:Zf-CCCH domain containing protein n=1 Tax=Trichuris trichiura TaxID=36087 RepID=A0A077ZCN9_TRITR|nr:zf-CCCH domain containing protein [Trichuris trichiura]